MNQSTDPNALAEPLGSIVRYGLELARRSDRQLRLVSGRRSIEKQIELRIRHCGGRSHYNIYLKPASRCRPVTAKPGKSAHQRGGAADISGPASTKRRDQDWLAAQLKPFGVTRTVPSEAWHFGYTGRNAGGSLKALRARMVAMGWGSATIAQVMRTEDVDIMEPWQKAELFAQAVERRFQLSRETGNGSWKRPKASSVAYWVGLYMPEPDNGPAILDALDRQLKKEPGSNLI